MAAKEVYLEATVVANKSCEVLQMEDETLDTITKQIGEVKDRKKTISTYLDKL